MSHPGNDHINDLIRDEIYREADGHTYYQCQTGHWVGAPTNLDGTPDLENVSYVTDFKEYMSPEDYKALTDWLRETVADILLETWPEGDKEGL